MAEAKLCAVEGCGKRSIARDLCSTHYQKARRVGTLPALRFRHPSHGACRVDGCEANGRLRLGMCYAHYKRWYRHGDPHAGGTSMGAVIEWVNAHVGHTGRECLIWPFARLSTGYGAMRFRGRRADAHRVMCILAHGEPPTPEHEAAHSCGGGAQGCVNPGHLRWATRAENMLDRVEHGSGNRGQTHYRAKLTEDDVMRIRSLAGSVPQSVIAAMFGIDQSHVSDLVKRKRWAWLP